MSCPTSRFAAAVSTSSSPEGETILGRGLDCEVVIDSPVVSRRHAALIIRGDKVLLRDLGSRNGLVLNGTPIGSNAQLRSDDRFSIGDIEFLLIRRPPAPDASERRSTVPPVASDPSRPSIPSTSETSRASAFDLLRTVLVPHAELVKRYQHRLATRQDELSPPDRFALKRLDGLERLIALKGA